MRTAVRSAVRNGVSRYTKPGSIFAALGSKLLLYTNPNLLDTVTYVPGAVTTWTGTNSTSKIYHTAHNAALDFSSAFTFSLEYQPTAATGFDEYLLGKCDVSLTNGWFIRHHATGANTYNLDFFLPGVFGCRIAAANFRAGGHILICFDGTLGSNGDPNSPRIKIYHNGTEYSRAAGNLTFLFSTTPPATITNNTFGMAIGATPGNYSTPGRVSAIYHRLHIWNQDKWADRAAIWNSGTPQAWSALSAGIKSGGVAAWDFEGTFTGNESSTSYIDAVNGLVMQCRFHGTTGSTVGGTTATETALIARRIVNPFDRSVGWRFPSGRGFRYYHPSLHTGGYAALFNKAALDCVGLMPANGNYANWGYWDGDVSSIANYDNGDLLCVNHHRDVEAYENFYLSFMVDGSPSGATKYFIPGYKPNAGNQQPTVRQANPPAHNGNTDFTDASLYVTTGLKALTHFWRASGEQINYRRMNLTDRVTTTSAAQIGGQPAGWTSQAGTKTWLILGGHEASSLLDGGYGTYVLATGLTASERTRLYEAVAAQYV